MHHGNHQLSYAIFSVVVAILGSWTAFDLLRQVRMHAGPRRQYWLLGASLAMGISIWSANFLASLGLEVGMPISYDSPLLAFSLVIAIGGTAFAFISVLHVEPSGPPPKGKLAIAGVAMGASIALMTYVGLAAMRVPATLVYSIPVVVASFAIAVVTSGAAITTATRSPGPTLRAAGAVVLGVAIAGIHFTAHASVSFDPNGAGSDPGGIDQSSLAVLVGSGTTALLVLCLMSAVFDRRLGAIAVREARTAEDNERHLRQILTLMPLGIVAMSRAGAVVFTNPQADAILAGRSPLSLPFLDQEGAALPADLNPFRLALDAGAPLERHLARIARPDGRTGSLEITATSVADDGGEGEVVLMINDATARVEAETALAQAQKLETIGQLTGGVAHDFNNLLTPIVGGLDMLRRDQTLSPKAVRIIEGAMQASQRAATLVQRLLAFARRQTLQARTVDLHALLVGLEDLIGRSIGPIIDTTIESPAGLGVRVDPGQLELAILNLAVNARDAMPEGGRLSIAANPVRVDAHEGLSLPDGEYVCISVSDNGSGMDEATRRRAVEPFFSTKGLGKGTGLGLSMAHGLAAQSQGEMRITSSPGVGTRIDLFLPSVELPAEETSRAEVDGGSLAEGLTTTILLVDDEEIVRVATCEVLTDLGHEVLQASSGIQALGMVRANPDIGLVVTDHLMPGMTGAALAGELSIAAPQMPVLIITGYANPSELPRHLPFLSKPFRRADLVRQIDRMLASAPNVTRLTRPRAG